MTNKFYAVDSGDVEISMGGRLRGAIPTRYRIKNTCRRINFLQVRGCRSLQLDILNGL